MAANSVFLGRRDKGPKEKAGVPRDEFVANVGQLLDEIQDEFNLSFIFVAHDLSVLRHTSDRVAVMYLGRIVEIGHWTAISREPRHPYTKGLMGAIPHLGAGAGRALESIPGTVPDLADLPTGCSFHPRCPEAGDDCQAALPDLEDVGDRLCACFRVERSR